LFDIRYFISNYFNNNNNNNNNNNDIHYIEIEPEKAKTLFYQYLEMAPSCAKQFPNAYYMLATLFAKTNIDEALRCYVIKIENPACAINVI
jgi:hypothetical protein